MSAIRCPDSEYLNRPLIENVEYSIEQDFVHIHSSCTCYIQARRYKEMVNPMQLYKAVSQTATERKIKKSYKRHFKRFIESEWDNYRNSCIKSSSVFDEIIKCARQIQERGLHMGTSDDLKLAEMATLRERYNTFFHGNQVISQMCSIKNSLDDYLKEMKNENDWLCKIYL